MNRAFHRHRGQATTEFVVLCLALVPVALIVPLLGKYIDLMHTAEAASRYVAFEGAVHHSSTGWKSDAALADEVRARFFGRSQAQIRSSDTVQDTNADRNLLWRDPSGRPLIDDFQTQVAVSATRQGFNFHGPTRFVWRDGFDLPDDNFVTGSVTVRPRNVAGLQPFDAIGLQITRRTAMLADPWAAGSLAQVRNRIEDSGPLYFMGDLDRLVTLVGKAPVLLGDEPLRPGPRSWEIVPCDRLQGGC